MPNHKPEMRKLLIEQLKHHPSKQQEAIYAHDDMDTAFTVLASFNDEIDSNGIDKTQLLIAIYNWLSKNPQF